MSLTVSSWNMQGAGAEKFASINLPERDMIKPDIFLLQETGNPRKKGFEEGKSYYSMGDEYYCGVACVDPTAVTLRCTNAVLIRASLYTQDLRFGAIEMLGHRYITYIVYRNIAFASIHAPAADDPSFAKDAVEAINNFSEVSDWVLMGDFNTDPLSIVPNGTLPDTVNEVHLRGTVSRPQLPCLLVYPSGATQGPNGTRVRCLDYAFLSDSLSRYRVLRVVNSRIYESPIPNPAALLSDHNMVAIQLGIWGGSVV